MNKKILTTAALSVFSLMGFAQLNDLDAGIDIYGMTMKDRMKDRAYVHFTSGRPGHLDRIAELFDNDEYLLQIPRCGAMTPDGFFGYMARQYSYEEYPLCFYKLNVETGEYETITDMTDNNRWGPNWPVMYDMEYNHHNGKLYGLSRYTTSDGMPSSSIYTINTKNGDYTNVLTNLGFYAIAMAVDFDGNFYFLKWESTDNENITGTILVKMNMDDDGELSQEWEKHIYVDGDEFIIYYLNDLAFDYTTGDLYWAADDKQMNWQRLIRISPETGETTKLGGIGSYESVNSLYIPWKEAESRTAPARVSAFGVEYADRGQSMTLSWTNPTTCWNRTELKNLSSINIARDTEDNIIASLDAAGQEGKRQEYTDDKATQGVHTYYVTAVNADGKGVVNSYLVQTGEDTPGKVANLRINKESDERVTISWSMPTIGAHDGWFDNSALTYNVTRYPDEKMVATGLTTTTFTDTNLGEYTNYSYKVEAVSTAGVGAGNTTSAVHAGSAIHAPYYATFTSWKEVNFWSVIDANGDGRTWTYDGEGTMDIFQRMALSCDYKTNDYLVSPKLYVEEGKTYRMTASINMDRPNQYFFDFCQGPEPNRESLSTFASFDHEIVFEQDDEYVTIPFEGTFKANFTGATHIAVRSTSEGSVGTNVAVYDVLFEEVPDFDLAMGEVSTIPDGIVGVEAKATVNVVNRGLKSIKKDEYEVQAINVDNGNVLGTGKGSYTLTPEDNEEIEFTFVPDEDGLINIAFRIVCDKDTNADNNQSKSLTMTVAEGDTQAWNVEVLEGDTRGERVSYETRLPFDFMSRYSVEQSIYPYELIGKAGKVTRIGYRYISNAPTTGNVQVTISLGKTNLEKFRTKSDALSASALTDVYDGVFTIDCTEGEHVLAFDTDGFTLEEGDNLVVSVAQKTNLNELFPIAVNCFNHDTNTWGTIRASSEKSMPAANTGQCIEAIPQILLAIDTEGADGIQTIEIGGDNTHVFDLTGRRVNAAQKGVFVINGQKVIK